MKNDTTLDQINFIHRYMAAKNAATGSDVDQNANVANKNIATLAAELPKKSIIALNRELMREKLTAMYGEDLANKYEEDLAHHIIYKHDETSIYPYCCSISLYPFLLDGLTKIGGSSTAPQHLIPSAVHSLTLSSWWRVNSQEQRLLQSFFATLTTLPARIMAQITLTT